MRLATILLHWLTRIATAAIIIVMLGFYFAFGGMPPWTVGFLFLALLIAGWVTAWLRPGIGGLIALAGVVMLYTWHYALTSDFPGGPFFPVFLLPTLLFLAIAAARRLFVEE